MKPEQATNNWEDKRMNITRNMLQVVRFWGLSPVGAAREATTQPSQKHYRTTVPVIESRADREATPQPSQNTDSQPYERYWSCRTQCAGQPSQKRSRTTAPLLVQLKDIGRAGDGQT